MAPMEKFKKFLNCHYRIAHKILLARKLVDKNYRQSKPFDMTFCLAWCSDVLQDMYNISQHIFDMQSDLVNVLGGSLNSE